MKELKITKTITNRDADGLSAYLVEISKEPRITVEEEINLAQRIKQNDEQAVEKLVKSNLRFVVSVAKQYQNRGLPLADLINEGNIGLIKAARRFDESRGFKFISYGVWWIRQSIMQALSENSNIVRLPINQVGLQNKIFNAIAIFEGENERKPTAAELSEILDIPEEKILDAQSLVNYSTSIDRPISDDDESTTFGDIMEDDYTPSTDDALMKESLQTEINRMLNILSDKEKYIIRFFYGIGCKEKSLDEIAVMFGLSKERVRQLRDKALRRLQKSSSLSLLKLYL